MQHHSFKEFKKLVSSADIVYGMCSLNAAIRVSCRIRKKTLIQELEAMDKNADAVRLGFFADMTTDKKGRKILKFA
jgi:hypothetical protein